MPDTEALIRAYVEAVNARDGATLMGILDADLVHDDFDGTRAIGREAFRERLAARARDRRETMADVEVLVSPTSGRAAAEFTLRGESAAGESLAVPAGEFYDTDDGRISRIASYSRQVD